MRLPWIERVRPIPPWLIVLLPIVAVVAAGLPFGGWRTPDVVLSTDPRTLFPGMQLNLEPLSSAIPRWLTTAAIVAAAV